MAEKGEKKQGVSLIAERAKKELSAVTGLELSTILGMEKDGNDWKVTLEMIEKRSIPDAMDILGTYEVHLSNDGQMLNFTRISLRKRGDTGG